MPPEIEPRLTEEDDLFRRVDLYLRNPSAEYWQLLFKNYFQGVPLPKPGELVHRGVVQEIVEDGHPETDWAVSVCYPTLIYYDSATGLTRKEFVYRGRRFVEGPEREAICYQPVPTEQWAPIPFDHPELKTKTTEEIIEACWQMDRHWRPLRVTSLTTKLVSPENNQKDHKTPREIFQKDIFWEAEFRRTRVGQSYFWTEAWRAYLIGKTDLAGPTTVVYCRDEGTGELTLAGKVGDRELEEFNLPKSLGQARVFKRVRFSKITLV